MKDRVLLVHPEVAPLQEIAAALERHGFTVVAVPDGERAIDRFIQKPVGTLVTELVLPGRDGATTAESIRWAPRGQTVTVVLLATRGSSTSTIQDAQERAHATAVYQGSVDVETIVRCVEQAVAPEKVRPTVTPIFFGEDVDLEDGDDTNDEPLDNVPSMLVDASAITGADQVTQLSRDLSADAEAELSQRWSMGDDPRAEEEGLEIAQRVESLTAVTAPLEGELADTPFAQLLHQLHVIRATGGLVIENGQDPRRTTTGDRVIKIVYFEEGAPVFVQSNLVQECLGHILARAGRIGTDAIEESVRRMREEGVQQGAVLIDMEVVNARELRNALEDQLHVKLFDLFAWSKGTYRFAPETPLPASTVTLMLSIPEIVFRGVVHRIPPKRLLGLLGPHLDGFVVPNADRCRGFADFPMPQEARAVLYGLDGQKQLGQLLSEAGQHPGSVAQLVYSLRCVEAVKFQSTPCPTRRLSEVPDPAQESSDQRTILAELRTLASLLQKHRFAEALGVDAADSAGASIAAGTLRSRFRAIGERTTSGEIRRLAREVAVGLSHAERAVTGANQGAEEEEEPTVVGKRLPSSEDGFHSTAEGDSELGRTTVTDGDPDRGWIDQDEEEEPTVEGVPPTASDASTGSADQVEAPRSSDVESGSPPRPGTSDADDLEHRVQNLYRAERLFRQGCRALDRERYDEALACFEEAAAACPDEGEFLAHAGYARFLSQGVPCPQAQADVAKASELSPKLCVVHLFRARVAEAHGDVETARDSFLQALTADPDCDEAARALKQHKPGSNGTPAS